MRGIKREQSNPLGILGSCSTMFSFCCFLSHCHTHSQCGSMCVCVKNILIDSPYTKLSSLIRLQEYSSSRTVNWLILIETQQIVTSTSIYHSCPFLSSDYHPKLSPALSKYLFSFLFFSFSYSWSSLDLRDTNIVKWCPSKMF